MLEVSEQTVTNWELSYNEPEISYIPRIIEFIGYCPYLPTHSPIARLEMIRQALGLSYRELAKKVGVDESSLIRYSRGKGKPARKPLAKIVAFLKLLQAQNETWRQ